MNLLKKKKKLIFSTRDIDCSPQCRNKETTENNTIFEDEECKLYKNHKIISAILMKKLIVLDDMHMTWHLVLFNNQVESSISRISITT